jgi:hypothetical protein
MECFGSIIPVMNTLFEDLPVDLKKKKEKPGEAELILTHHFFTPEVIKKQINKNSYFLYYVSRPWNTPPFKKKTR